MSKPISRRSLFRLRPTEFARLFRESGKSRRTSRLPEPLSPEDENAPRPIRPPGSMVDETSFLSICQRCSHCVMACPHQAIEPLGPEAGFAERTPVMHPETAPCHWCEDMPCIEACPSGALSYGPDRIVAPIGKAVLHLETCLTTEGVPCETCAKVCPPHVRAIDIVNGRPELNEDRCTGCGLCAYHCESTPGSIHIRLV